VRNLTSADRAVLIAYAFTLIVALVVGMAFASEHPIRVAFYADVAATCAIFAFSVAWRNSSFYDPYWSVAPPFIALYWLLASNVPDVDRLRCAVVIGLVTAWAVRLTWNWRRGWTGLDHEDWRYRDMREKTGGAYWLVSFAGIHMVPTLLVFAGCLPLYPALAVGTRPFGVLDVVAVFWTAGAIWIEARADRELADFRRSSPPAGSTLTSGVWRYSRHPNYFGEVAFWWGLAMFGVAAAPEWWWSAVGALSITLMFRFISLKLIDDRMSASRPDYGRYVATTSRLVPWPPKADLRPDPRDSSG
jgi:steroid 5-alpha reductase family enzyme